MSFLSEIKRRNIYRVAAAYAVIAWMLVQVTSVFTPALNLPEWPVSLLALLAVIGFPVALALAWLYELTPEGLKRAADVPPEQSTRRLAAQKLNYVIVGALVVAVVFLGIDNYRTRSTAVVPGAASAAPSGVAPPAPPREALPNSVAVLPFANLSPNADDAYFAQGIHEEVLNQLAKIGRLNVIARTSVLRYGDGQTAIPDIARQLNVQTVMEGSVRYAGDDVRITAQLIDSTTGAHLWSEAYQRKTDDIFAIQADIAMNIANALRAEFSLEEQQAIEKPLTSSPEAYALYLQARNLPVNASELRNALLDRAIALDPLFAAAYGTKARFYSGQLANNAFVNAARPEERAEIERRLHDYAQRALALDPNDIAARGALAAWDVQHWRWPDVTPFKANELGQVFTGAPSTVWVRAWNGDSVETLEVSRRWAELDPNSGSAFVNLGVLEAYAGNRAGSSRAFARAIEINALNTLARAWLGYNAAASGDVDAALRELAQCEQVLGDNPPVVYLPELAYAYSRVGRGADARRLFDRLESAAKTQEVGAGAFAVGYLAIGDEERALAYLEEVATKARNHQPDAGYLNVMNLKMNFMADPRVETPRFADVLGRIRGY